MAHFHLHCRFKHAGIPFYPIDFPGSANKARRKLVCWFRLRPPRLCHWSWVDYSQRYYSNDRGSHTAVGQTSNMAPVPAGAMLPQGRRSKRCPSKRFLRLFAVGGRGHGGKVHLLLLPVRGCRSCAAHGSPMLAHVSPTLVASQLRHRQRAVPAVGGLHGRLHPCLPLPRRRQPGAVRGQAARGGAAMCLVSEGCAEGACSASSQASHRCQAQRALRPSLNPCRR